MKKCDRVYVSDKDFGLEKVFLLSPVIIEPRRNNPPKINIPE